MTSSRLLALYIVNLTFLLFGGIPDVRAVLISGTLQGVVTEFINAIPEFAHIQLGDPASVSFRFDTNDPEGTVSMTSNSPGIGPLSVPTSEANRDEFLFDLSFTLLGDFLSLDFQSENFGTSNFNAIYLTATGHFFPGTHQLNPLRSRLINLFHAEPAGFYIASQPVPEPSTYLLFVTGLLGLLGYGWRKSRA